MRARAAPSSLSRAGLGLLEGPRRDLVLQAFELPAELRGQEVCHDRQQLADLDEEALQTEDGGVDAARVAGVDLADARVA